MAVNENYYGLKENWVTLGGSEWQSQIPSDEQFKFANFLNNSELVANPTAIRKGAVLGNAIYKAYKTDSAYYDPTFEATLMGKVFDESIEFAGMSGDYCPYSRIMYYSNRREQEQGSIRELVNEGEELIDVWNYFYTSYIPTYSQGYGNLVRRWDDFYVAAPQSPSGTSGYEFTAMRWLPSNPQDSPLQIGKPSSSYPYYYTDYATRNMLTFITQFPCRRTVLVPTVTCSDDALNPTNVKTYDLYTYLNEYKETRPIVWSIQVLIYTKAGVSDLPTTSDKRVSRQTMMMASNTPLSLPFRNGSPYVQTMSAGGTIVNEDNPFMAPQIIPTGSNCTPIGGPINVGLGASGGTSSLWELQGGNGYNSFSVWAVINCGALEFNNWTSRIIGGGTVCRCYCNAADYSKQEFREAVRHAVACFGMFFTDSTAYAETAQLDDDAMHLGVLVNGIGYGEYTSGEKNTEQPQFGWKTMQESDYDPSNPPSPPIVIPPSNPTTFNPVTLADGGLKRYVLDDSSMTNFGAELWNVINTSNPDELIQNQTLTNFLTNNPLDCIVSIKRFPLADMRQGDQTNPMLGKVKIRNVIVYPFSSSSTILSCGTKKIPRFFNDFRDYLVQYELILPFCGTISLDSAAVTGNEIEVKYAIDYTTGTCTAWVLANTTDGKQVVIDSANGNCTIDIPLSGVQTATLTGQIYNANENLKTAKFNGIISGVTGAGSFIQDVKNRNIGGAIGTGAKIVNAVHDVKKMEWNIDHTEIPLKMVGASSGCNSFQIELVPRLTAYVPNVTSDYSESDYLHNVGAAVCDTTTIGNYSGYAEITNVDMSGFPATSTEKNMIATALSGGVYL